MSYAAIF